MYRHEDFDPLPFGVTLREDNRWVVLSKKFPWEEIDREYMQHFKSKVTQVAMYEKCPLKQTRGLL